MVDVGVDFGRDWGARNVGAFPGARHQVRGKWVFPRARLEVRGRRVFPGRKYLLCIGRLLYKLGLSAISQEALSMYMNVFIVCNCK